MIVKIRFWHPGMKPRDAFHSTNPRTDFEVKVGDEAWRPPANDATLGDVAFELLGAREVSVVKVQEKNRPRWKGLFVFTFEVDGKKTDPPEPDPDAAHVAGWYARGAAFEDSVSVPGHEEVKGGHGNVIDPSRWNAADYTDV